jgi:hypothetical protein
MMLLLCGARPADQLPRETGREAQDFAGRTWMRRQVMVLEATGT